LLDVFFGGRAMTGYHFWMLSFVFVLAIADSSLNGINYHNYQLSYGFKF